MMEDSMANQGEKYTSRPCWRTVVLLCRLERACCVAARQQLPQEDDPLTQPVQGGRDECTEGGVAREFCAILGKGHCTRCQHVAVVVDRRRHRRNEQQQKLTIFLRQNRRGCRAQAAGACARAGGKKEARARLGPNAGPHTWEPRQACTLPS
ncbi:hypothetical protein L226DRAFT_192175 [Lentinus tigrinus ALCF2SS1-7]|uniref:Uncharacterized protein n=1 Tax=Lentinus tigrinus ALCF2SS1-6 TaxID=1328759 RepID=A0A5C2ST24_9APHY|nr:hypothetical protein L227DRAFT_137178 [Lentinus tigrinus ALCF2SS1-6]RPD80160.1 hypothetical protein L226DRAFT_192175 [Lentinus tigrinus ALCF2SS1-7]